jgi:hypothetical protein
MSYKGKNIVVYISTMSAKKSINLVFCKDYIESGTCASGRYCRFPHPIREEDREALKNAAANGKTTTVCLRHLSGKREDEGFTSGGCKFGDDCRYNHFDFTLNVSGILNMAQKLKKADGKKSVSIRFCNNYINTGTCKNGKFCRFAHITDDTDRAALQEYISTRNENLEVCTRHLAGIREDDGSFREGCSYGDKCKFCHADFTINPTGLINMISHIGSGGASSVQVE